MGLVTLRRRADRLGYRLGEGDEYCGAMCAALHQKLVELLRNPEATRRFVENLQRTRPDLADRFLEKFSSTLSS